MDSIIIRQSRRKTAFQLLFFAAIALPSLSRLVDPRDAHSWIRWYELAILPLGLYYGAPLVWSLIRPGVLRIGEDGVEVQIAWSRTMLPWSRITDVGLHSRQGELWEVVLRLTGRPRWKSLWGWAIEPKEILQLINERRLADAYRISGTSIGTRRL